MNAHNKAFIGPNAILKTVAALDQTEGRACRDAVMIEAGVAVPAENSGMLPETDCAAVHKAVRQLLPSRADAILRASGVATADYIIAHRIPRAVKALIGLVPPDWGAWILARAIERHAWTFVGTGRFRIVSHQPLVFELVDNPLIEGLTSPEPICHWHIAVFERLFSQLIWPDAYVTEDSCTATGDAACRFRVEPGPEFHLGTSSLG